VYPTAEATAACLAMVIAIERAGSLEPNKVRDALAGLDVDTFFGPIRFDPTGKNTAKPMYVIQIQDGKIVTVWPRGSLTQPMRPPAPAAADTGGTSGGARFAQSTVYGLLQGGLYGLVGVGFSMVWGVTNIVNLSQGVLAVGGVRVPYGRLVGFVLAVLLTAALAAFLGRTRLGRAIRGTGMDRGAARLMGIPVAHIYAVTFGLAAALAGAAGAVIGTVSTFSPAAAGGFTLRSFVVAVLGGLGNMWGALAGGILRGVVEAWGGPYLSGTLVNAISFAVLVAVLVVRPSGLLGRPFYETRIEAT